MDTSHSRVNAPRINQPQHVDDQCIKSPCKVSLIGLGIILMIGAAVAAGLLYSQLGYASLIYLGAVPIAIALIVVGARCTKADTHQSTRNSGTNGTVGKTAPTTADIKDVRLNSKNVVSIGSQESRLDENGIREELGKLSGKKNVDILLIYGDGSVRFNTDPGFVDMNPKKVILVDARIIHAPCSVTRLDDTLADKKEWLGSMFRAGSGGNMDEATCIKQLEMPSIQEAIDHKPDKYSFMQRYHVVYRVSQK
jgi:hypothetical protein